MATGSEPAGQREDATASPALERPIRVLISKCGLDGHDRGARVVARSLRDAGFEVVYLGIRQTPSTVVQAAIEEDVDAIGISIHSAAHMTILPKIVRLLREHGADHILVVGGGIIPEEDVAELKRLGVAEIFRPGASMGEYIRYLRRAVAERREQISGDGA
ncbi:MAG: cobalamin B12-binding domain-containing protein [Planctomycetota bacterium]|nr:MAG: cobalamin B12-binding domain-containing protein [Planctomycetota bacterium]